MLLDEIAIESLLEDFSSEDVAKKKTYPSRDRNTTLSIPRETLDYIRMFTFLYGRTKGRKLSVQDFIRKASQRYARFLASDVANIVEQNISVKRLDNH